MCERQGGDIYYILRIVTRTHLLHGVSRVVMLGVQFLNNHRARLGSWMSSEVYIYIYIFSQRKQRKCLYDDNSDDDDDVKSSS